MITINIVLLVALLNGALLLGAYIHHRANGVDTEQDHARAADIDDAAEAGEHL